MADDVNPFLAILRETFPSVFPKGAPQCGYNIGPGWFPLVFEATRKMNGLVVASQVKEKFGTLRFYFDFPDERDLTDEEIEIVNAAANEAESSSATTCEDCCEPGVLRKHKWLRTLCDACNDAFVSWLDKRAKR